MIRVCEHCSNVNVELLKEAAGEKNVKVGCIEKCAAYADDAYGYIDDEIIVEKSSENFIKKIFEVK
jgi:uncharacterized protein YuzB (UPF0349 family)